VSYSSKLLIIPIVGIVIATALTLAAKKVSRDDNHVVHSTESASIVTNYFK